jgi:hypothetical protein
VRGIREASVNMNRQDKMINGRKRSRKTRKEKQKQEHSPTPILCSWFTSYACNIPDETCEHRTNSTWVACESTSSKGRKAVSFSCT